MEKRELALTPYEDVEMVPPMRVLIESNLSSLNTLLKERYKKIVQEIVDEVGAERLEWRSEDASEPGITLTDGFSFSGSSEYRVEEETLKYLFNYDCTSDVTIDPLALNTPSPDSIKTAAYRTDTQARAL